MIQAIKSFFGVEGVTNTALKIVDKIAGTDWTPKEKADYILKYMETTKHQSPARRLIAIGILFEQMVMAFSWLVCLFLGMEQEGKAISEFLTSNVNVALNVIIGFYFLTHMVSNK